MQTTIQNFEAHLPEYLDRALAGEEVTLTRNGKSVLRLAPVVVEKSQEELEREAMARLDAQPWIRPPIKKSKIKGSDKPIPWNPGEKTLSDLVLEDRV